MRVSGLSNVSAAIMLIASLVLVAASVRSALHARSNARAAQRELMQVRALVSDLNSLGRDDASQAINASTRGSELPPVLTQALTSVGLPASMLASYSVSATKRLSTSERVADDGLTHERAALVLSGLTLPEVGRFLSAWREAQPAWIVTAIELTPLPVPSDSATGGGKRRDQSKSPGHASYSQIGSDRALRAALTLEALVKVGEAIGPRTYEHAMPPTPLTPANPSEPSR